MALCVQCGLELSRDQDLCPHHLSSYPANWSGSNRIMCDFVHRQRVPSRPVEDIWEWVELR